MLTLAADLLQVNYRRNPTSYRLPPLLKPSALQQSKPHDPTIDSMPFQGLRDKLVEHQGACLVLAVWALNGSHNLIPSTEVDISEVWTYIIEFAAVHEGVSELRIVISTVLLLTPTLAQDPMSIYSWEITLPLWLRFP